MSSRGLAVELERRGIQDPRVLEAFAAVRRELFVPGQEHHAYADGPLPIGFGQTISQPYVVALTVQALDLRETDRVLEIGTGSGYAAAILALLAGEVDTIERIPALAAIARERLARLAPKVRVHEGDGTLGIPDRAPFDAIAVAAGAPRPPPSLLHQLALGGRLVLPTGSTDRQRLVRITRTGGDSFVEVSFGDVQFVPLVGAEGWPATPPSRRPS